MCSMYSVQFISELSGFFVFTVCNIRFQQCKIYAQKYIYFK